MANEAIDRELARRELCEILEEALSFREFEVVTRHYGLIHGDRETLRDIAVFFGVSERQIKRNKRYAIEKIRADEKIIKKVCPLFRGY